MEIKEILKLTAFYLQMDSVLELTYLSDGFKGDIPETTQAEKDLIRLLKCANLVCGEIASEYYPLILKESVTSVVGVISPFSLSKRLIDVKRITQNGSDVQFKMYPSGINTVGGKVEIEYSYLPESLKIDGLLDFGDKISPRIIAYGTAAEYCLISGLFDEAVIWEKRYKDSLLSAQRKKSEIRVKARQWK